MLQRLLLLALPLAMLASDGPIRVNVDASEFSRRIVHATLTYPVAPGPFTLLYPKWIPGEHGPTGPVADMVNLKVTAAGKPLAWRRDDVDMYAVKVNVPSGVDEITVSLDFVSPPEGKFSAGASSTADLGVLSWNQVLLYPAGRPSDQIQLKATLTLPAEWRYGTALPIERESGSRIDFQPASLTTMVDSPVIAGRHFRTIELGDNLGPRHYIHMAGDSAAALDASDPQIAAWKQLVAETGALFGARHYRSYHFLLSLSDYVSHFGLEHHESSDDRISENGVTDDNGKRIHNGLLPHEFVHSWNGKYRRPAGLATANYDQPMRGELLWVYEGLTEYLGMILTPRSGLETAEQFREDTASIAAALERSAGRTWRPLADTAVAAQLLYEARSDWANLRRGVDYYPEGFLIWFEADTLIRQKSGGTKTLDDFCKRFHGGDTGAPQLKTYTLDSLIADLNAVQPYDWKSFFDERIYQVQPHAPLGGIENAGWKLVYTDRISSLQRAIETENKTTDLWYSLGLALREDGTIADVVADGPAARAGLAPGMTLVAVNSDQYDSKLLRTAIRQAKNSTTAIELLAKNSGKFKTFRIDYHDGERYPALERIAGKPDLLSDMIAPRAK